MLTVPTRESGAGVPKAKPLRAVKSVQTPCLSDVLCLLQCYLELKPPRAAFAAPAHKFQTLGKSPCFCKPAPSVPSPLATHANPEMSKPYHSLLTEVVAYVH